ncbi:hypothetical protein GCM10023238_31190 [Streptomyces heliomycini]
MQRDPLKGFLEHVDLQLVQRGETVTVEIPVLTEGELAAGGNLLEHVLGTLTVEAEATHIPESVTVSVEGLEAGASVLAKDVPLPKGAKLAVEEDAVVIQVLAAQARRRPPRVRRGGRRGLILVPSRRFVGRCSRTGQRPTRMRAGGQGRMEEAWT